MSELTEAQIEAMARWLCKRDGYTPDQPTAYDPENMALRQNRWELHHAHEFKYPEMPRWQWGYVRNARETLEAALVALNAAHD